MNIIIIIGKIAHQEKEAKAVKLQASARKLNVGGAAIFAMQATNHIIDKMGTQPKNPQATTNLRV